jgi:hypothetical protein
MRKGFDIITLLELLSIIIFKPHASRTPPRMANAVAVAVAAGGCRGLCPGSGRHSKFLIQKLAWSPENGWMKTANIRIQ